MMTNMAYDFIFECNNMFNEYQILSEANFLDMLTKPNKKINIGDIIGFIVRAINALIDIISGFLRFITRLFKQFIISAQEAELANSVFMKKYGPYLSRIASASVKIPDAYDMDRMDLYKFRDSIEAISSIADLKSVVLDGKVAFPTKMDMLQKLKDNRITLVGDNVTPGMVKLDKDFRSNLTRVYFGDRAARTYYIHQAVDTINKYDSRVEEMNRLHAVFKVKAERDIAELEQLKRLVSANSNATMDTMPQLDMLIKYRSIVLGDTGIAYETMMQYINTINLQAKSICILGLQEH